MSPLVIAILLFAGLAVASYFSKRRFGTLGLALCGGYLLSQAWSTEAGYMITALGVVPSDLMIASIASIVVTVLPSIVLMFKGRKYHSVPTKLIGSALYATLGVTLMLPAVQSLGTVADTQNILSIVTQNKDLIVGVLIPLAVVDLLLVRPAPKLPKKSKR